MWVAKGMLSFTQFSAARRVSLAHYKKAGQHVPPCPRGCYDSSEDHEGDGVRQPRNESDKRNVTMRLVKASRRIQAVPDECNTRMGPAIAKQCYRVVR